MLAPDGARDASASSSRISESGGARERKARQDLRCATASVTVSGGMRAGGADRQRRRGGASAAVLPVTRELAEL